MPAISEINLKDGITITGAGIASYNLKLANFPQITVGMTADQLSTQLTKLVQSSYEDKWLFSNYFAICKAKNPTTPDNVLRAQIEQGLDPRERIEKIAGKEYLITILMYVKILVYSLTPLAYGIRCSDFPIPASEVF